MKYFISRIILFVKDVEGMAAFYENAFEMKRIEDSDGWIELAAKNCNIALHSSNTTARERGRSMTKVVFAVKDIDEAKIELKKKGLRFGKTHDVGPFSFSNARDPEGNPIQISGRGL